MGLTPEAFHRLFPFRELPTGVLCVWSLKRMGNNYCKRSDLLDAADFIIDTDLRVLQFGDALAKMIPEMKAHRPSSGSSCRVDEVLQV